MIIFKLNFLESFSSVTNKPFPYKSGSFSQTVVKITRTLLFFSSSNRRGYLRQANVGKVFSKAGLSVRAFQLSTAFYVCFLDKHT